MTEQNQNLHREENIDIKRFLVKTISNWPLFVISLGIALAIAYLVNRYTEPMYSVNASIIINEEKKTSLDMLIPALDRFYSRRNVENEISILKSYTLIKRALSELDFSITYTNIGRINELKTSKPIISVALDSLNGNRKGYPIYITILDENRYQLEINNQYNIRKIFRFGEPVKYPDFNFTVFLNKNEYLQKPTPKAKISFIVNDVNVLTKIYMAKLGVSTSEKKSTVVDLSTYGPIPQQEVDFLNKLCEVYIRNGLEEKNLAAINTIKFIDIQLGSISDSLKRAEVKLQNFRLENRILDISKEGTSIYNNLDDLQKDKAIADLQLRYYQYLKDYIENKTKYDEIVAPSTLGISEPLLNSLVEELAELFRQKTVLGYSAQGDNPSINLINLKIEKTIATLKENVNEMINAAKIQSNDVNKRIDEQEKELKKLPVTERQLINIRRDFDINNNIYTFLLQKRAESGITKASNISDNKILDGARLDNVTQISPKRSKNYLTAMFLGTLLPLIIIFLVEYFNTRITDLRELEKLKNCNVIGTIGHNGKQSELPVFENPKSAISESFRSLRTNLQYILRDRKDNVILITSTISGEGKTFCAINMATILAMSNKKVLLMGLDLRKPKIHKLFNISNETGLSNYLINQASKEDIISATNVNNLFVITSGPIPPNPAELLETEAMENLMTELKEEFDFIILDTPPIAIVTDAIILSKFAGASVFVIRHNFSSKDVVYLADELSEKLSNLNVLINDVNVPGYYGYSFKYGYKYSYGYRYNYGYNYYTTGHEYYGEAENPKSIIERIKRLLS